MAIEHIHGGDVKGALACTSKKRIYDFSANINPLGIPKSVELALKKHISSLVNYPEIGSEELCLEIAKYHNVKPENIIIGNGSTELIYLFARTFKPKSAIIPMPTFSEYEMSLRTQNAKISFLKLSRENGFKLSIDDLDPLPTLSLKGEGKSERKNEGEGERKSKKKSDVNILYICNPNNPTGTLTEKEVLLKLLRTNKFLFIDEVFMDFVDEAHKFTMLDMAIRLKNIFILKSLTKLFALPGLRLGYGIAHPEIIEKLKLMQEPWNVNTLAQIAGIYALKDKTYIKNSFIQNKIEREYLYNALLKINGITPLYPNANFIFIELLNKNADSRDIALKMLKLGLPVRDCSSFRNLGNKFIRVAVKSRRENKQLLKTIKNVVG